MDQGGKGSPHKLPGVASRLPGPEDFCSRSPGEGNPDTHRQCDSFGLLEQDGRIPFIPPIQLGNRDLEMVCPKVHSHSRRTPSRKGKCKSRLGVTALEGFKRLEITQGNLPAARGETWTILDRSLCLQDQHTTSSLLQLETGPNGTDSGCPFNFVERSSSVLVSSIYSDQQMS